MLTEDEVTGLADAYDRRCATGHQGSLHGAESTLGVGDFSLFRPDPTSEFEVAAYGMLCNASRQVVVAAIKKGIEQAAALPHAADGGPANAS